MSAGVPDADADAVRRLCATVLRGNWREGVRASDGVAYAYTCPSPGHYRYQWYWDSCFAAIVWRHVDPERSRRELESLLAAQRSDGFIGHTIFWDGPLRGWRRLTYNVTSSDAEMTASIQPPALAWAWSQTVGDPAGEPRIVAHHEWLAANRDLDGDGLIWIVQPDESGLDASPQFDPIWGAEAHGLIPGFARLVARNRRRGYDLRTIAAAGGPICCEILTNVVHSLSRTALGQPSLTAQLIERCWDERRGLFLPLARGARHPDRSIPATVAALSPLALPDLPEEIGHRLAAHLLDPDEFWTAVAPASVSIADPTFTVRDTGALHQLRYWRGPTWVNTAWLCSLGLRRLGYERPATELSRRLTSAIATAGLREYYDPFTGAGMGAREFAWSALVLELLG